MPRPPADKPYVPLETRPQWRAWLLANHQASDGIWLVGWRPGCGPRIPYEDLVLEALCFGWIDGHVRTLDEQRSATLVTPRRPGSTWARPNKLRIEALRAAGLMHPAGEAVIARAVADGSWTVLDEVEDLMLPADLAAELAAAGATQGYEALTRGRRKQILWWVKSAKRPATRAARIAATVAAAAQHRSPLD